MRICCGRWLPSGRSPWPRSAMNCGSSAAYRCVCGDEGLIRNFVRSLGMIGAKESDDAATQRTSHSRSRARSSACGADPKTAFDPNGLLDALKKALAERV